ncbi:MAG: DUF5606 domain-containing protein [Bacteroidetes bacterium]|nr:DUF5606 domain-containing protein [Bacteroidota bacterium]
MVYREIVAVTGLSGLFQLLATKSDGAIVRNLADKSTKFISARLHNVTPLESIEVYTTGDNVRLHNVFQKMKDSEGTTPLVDAKADNNAVKSYFKSIFPEFDDERVYVSDMKKMVKWFEILKANDMLNFESMDEATAEAEVPAAETATEVAEEKPAKKSKAAKTEATEEGAEEKPAKKARAKKAAEPVAEGEEKPAKKTAKKKKTEE